MIVTLVSGIYPPDIGGPATYIPELARYLTDSGETVQVVSLTNGKSQKIDESWRIFLISRGLRRAPRFFRVCFNLLTLKTSIYFANGMHEEVAVINILKRKRAIAKIVGDPVWERARNSGFQCGSIEEFNSTNLPKRYLIQRNFLTWSLNRYNLVICPSEELVQIVRNWGVKTPVKYLANGVPRTDLKVLNRQNEVIAVSRLVPWKNLDILICACAKLGASLNIAGEGPEEEKLRNLAIKLGANVTFSGSLNSKGVIDLLSNSGVFVLLSDYEGQSFALLQAMSLGIPVLVSTAKGNTQVIHDNFNGLVVNPKLLDSVVEQLGKILQSPALQEFLGANAKETVATKYSLQVNCQRVHELLLGIE
jgi:glycosyltransferase involved in cell wall biosynthesis